MPLRTVPATCGRKHPLDDANTYIDKTGKWHCRACHRAVVAERRQVVLEARKRELDARLAARPEWPDAELAWAAGLFEGEGTVTILNAGRYGYVRSFATVTSTDREVLQPFHRMWGGRCRSVGYKSHNAREAWCWAVEGEGLMRFLLDLRPHIRTTRVIAKFDLMLEVQRLRRPGSRDPEYRAKLRGYREQMRLLNHRGRVPITDR